MTVERIKEIQSKTAHPESVSVQQALLQVWNECEQEQLRSHAVRGSLLPRKEYYWPDTSMADGSGIATHSSKLIALSIKTLGNIIQDCFQEPKK